MHLWSVEHFFNIFSLKLDSPSPMFWLKENLILSHVLITEESNFDEKNDKEMFNWSEFHSEKKYYLWNKDYWVFLIHNSGLNCNWKCEYFHGIQMKENSSWFKLGKPQVSRLFYSSPAPFFLYLVNFVLSYWSQKKESVNTRFWWEI